MGGRGGEHGVCGQKRERTSERNRRSISQSIERVRKKRRRDDGEDPWSENLTTPPTVPLMTATAAASLQESGCRSAHPDRDAMACKSLQRNFSSQSSAGALAANVAPSWSHRRRGSWCQDSRQGSRRESMGIRGHPGAARPGLLGLWVRPGSALGFPWLVLLLRAAMSS
ncbi:uncharacterized protein JN550_005436 [Neoarthrinium moseri]|uniref:uncharacterized protein n=1 Tax=Neoarthrinium moseri TaxID=1658444 RepID=UPI001FDB0DEC|nr:uncharacterized protein JN550_005436 [Neoarthrinium moseri]KAI1869846.1 hypothetical protein JN550_005436 [Neoarthrinium moseri]